MHIVCHVLKSKLDDLYQTATGHPDIRSLMEDSI